MNDHIKNELADREDAQDITAPAGDLTKEKRTRRTMSDEEKAARNEKMQTAKLQKELVEAKSEHSDIAAALAAGRERRDPREVSDSERDGDRIPLGADHLKLQLKGHEEQTKGYRPRWINDTGNRIAEALRGGYVPIIKNGHIRAGQGADENTDMGSWVSQIVGTQKGGQPLRAYCLMLRDDLYEEDQRAKRRKIEEIEETIKRAPKGAQYADEKGAYTKIATIGR